MNKKIKELAQATTIEEIEKGINSLAFNASGAILMDLLMPDVGQPEKIKWNINCTQAHLVSFAKTIAEFCAQSIDGAIKHKLEHLEESKTINYKDEYIRQEAIDSIENYIEGMQYGSDIIRDAFDWNLEEKYEREN